MTSSDVSSQDLSLAVVRHPRADNRGQGQIQEIGWGLVGIEAKKKKKIASEMKVVEMEVRTSGPIQDMF